MSEKMLKFVKIGQQNPPKREVGRRKEDFNEFIKISLMRKLKNNRADALNAVYLFAKFIVL